MIKFTALACFASLSLVHGKYISTPTDGTDTAAADFIPAAPDTNEAADGAIEEEDVGEGGAEGEVERLIPAAPDTNEAAEGGDETGAEYITPAADGEGGDNVTPPGDGDDEYTNSGDGGNGGDLVDCQPGDVGCVEVIDCESDDGVECSDDVGDNDISCETDDGVECSDDGVECSDDGVECSDDADSCDGSIDKGGDGVDDCDPDSDDYDNCDSTGDGDNGGDTPIDTPGDGPGAPGVVDPTPCPETHDGTTPSTTPGDGDNGGDTTDDTPGGVPGAPGVVDPTPCPETHDTPGGGDNGGDTTDGTPGGPDVPGVTPAPCPLTPQPCPLTPQPCPLTPQPCPLTPQPCPVIGGGVPTPPGPSTGPGETPDAGADVQVDEDAVYPVAGIAMDTGTCAFAGEDPENNRCPTAGTVASSGCLVSFASYNPDGTCVLAEDTVCRELADGTSGCAYPESSEYSDDEDDKNTKLTPGSGASSMHGQGLLATLVFLSTSSMVVAFFL